MENLNNNPYYNPYYDPYYDPYYPVEPTFWDKYKFFILLLLAFLLYYVFFYEDTDTKSNTSNSESKTESNTITLTFESKNGDEELKITDSSNNLLMNAHIIRKTGTTFTIATKDKSIFIHFLNDSSNRDLYLKKLNINGKNVNIKNHIRADLFFPNDEVRRNRVLNGEFAWGSIDEKSIYRIDL